MKIIFHSLAFTLLAATLAIATDDPPELLARRQDHLRAIQRVTAPLLRDYLRSLESLKQQFTRGGKLQQAIAVDAEMKSITAQLDIATQQIVIISAVYGIPAQNRVVNITKRLQDALASRETAVTLEIHGAAKGADPAPGMSKQTLITYTVNGQQKQKTFPDGHKLNLSKDLE